MIGGENVVGDIEISFQTETFDGYDLTCHVNGIWSMQYNGKEFAKVPGNQVGHILESRGVIPEGYAEKWQELCNVKGVDIAIETPINEYVIAHCGGHTWDIVKAESLDAPELITMAEGMDGGQVASFIAGMGAISSKDISLFDLFFLRIAALIVR